MGYKRRRATIWRVLIGSTLCLLCFLPSHVLAAPVAGNLNITTSPLPLNLVAKPGSSVSTDLRIQNSGSQTEVLKIDLQKFRAYGEDGKPQLISREPGDDYFDWVRFSETNFTAEPNVWKTIRMTITVPKTAAFGYYYAVVFSRANASPTTETRSNTIVGGSATLVLLEADTGKAKKQIDVLGFSADKKLYEFLPAKFSVRLRNTGDVHVAPSGTIFIMKGGRQVDVLSVNADKGNVLPGSNRVFSVNWNNGFPYYENKSENGKVVLNSRGDATQQLHWDISRANKLRFGHYTAKLLLAYDNGGRDVPVEGTLSFWVVPWKLLTLLLLIIILSCLGVWFIGKNIWQRVRRNRSNHEKI